MRKLGKILSLIVAAFIVVGMLPLNTAWAARGKVVLGESKTTVSDKFELEVGESIDLNFYGATGYVYKTDAASVHWKTDNSKIVSVDRKGVITGVAPGSATISLTVTVASTRTSYEGSAQITVKDQQSVKFQLVSYEKAILIYSTEEAAKEAYSKGIKMKREIRRSIFGTADFRDDYCKAEIDFKDKNIINLKVNFLNNTKYRFFAEGFEPEGHDEIVSWETVPSYAQLYYENAYMSSSGGRDITGTKSLNYCEASPVFTLFDQNGIIIGTNSGSNGSFEGVSGVSGTIKYFKDSATGNASLKTPAGGVVRISDMSQSITVHAVWTSDDKKTEIVSSGYTVIPEEYVIPDLGGTVEAIVVTKDKGNDIDWSNGSNWEGYVREGDNTSKVLWYFLASDGKKYSACADAYAADDINKLDSSKYSFVYEISGFENYSYFEGGSVPSTAQATVETRSGKILPYRSNSQVTISIYQCEEGKTYKTNKAFWVGEVVVNILDARDVDYIAIEDSYYETEIKATGVDNYVSIPFNLFDQDSYAYSMPVGNNSLRVEAAETKSSGIPATIDSWNSNRTGGTIKINMKNKAAGTYVFTVKYKNDVYTDVWVTVLSGGN